MRQDEETLPREPSPEDWPFWAKGARCGNLCRAQARHTARLHVTPAVVAPSFASFPVMCGASAEDSLSVREQNDTSDRHPDNRAAILYTQPTHVSVSLCSVSTSQIVTIMPKEY
jgi:hypothetical protein